MRRVLRPAFPVDLNLTLGRLRRGVQDPTHRLAAGEVWRATRTPDGPATIHVRAASGRIEIQAWGPGAGYALDHATALLGYDDRPESFRPPPGLVHDLHRRFRGLRFGRTGNVIEALVPSIIEQKVAGKEAFRSHAAMVRALGERAPGPGGLHLPPDPEVLAASPCHMFHRFGIERRRATAVIRACARASRVEEAATMGPASASARLRAFPGVGAWTAAEVAAVALGDPDAVSVGDYHLPHLVAWSLAGRPRGDDDLMLELLEPFRGHRGRVLRLLELGGGGAPRFGPRMRLRSIARM